MKKSTVALPLNILLWGCTFLAVENSFLIGYRCLLKTHMDIIEKAIPLIWNGYKNKQQEFKKRIRSVFD